MASLSKVRTKPRKQVHGPKCQADEAYRVTSFSKILDNCSKMEIPLWLTTRYFLHVLWIGTKLASSHWVGHSPLLRELLNNGVNGVAMTLKT